MFNKSIFDAELALVFYRVMESLLNIEHDTLLLQITGTEYAVYVRGK